MKNSFAFSENVVGVLIDSELDEQKMEEIQALLEERIKTSSPVNLYLEDECKQGISFLAFLKGLAFHYSHPESMRKVAIVTDLKWFQKSMEAKDMVVKTDLKAFDTSQRMEAMNWVMQ